MSRYVYVAGPYTGDEEANVARALAAATDLLTAGLYPYVPHLSHYWEAQHAQDYETWMGLDFGWVRRCDALLRLPGASKGADREVDLAVSLRLPVFYSVEAVLAWAHVCGCGHQHYSGTDGEDGGCRDGSCHCGGWRAA